MNAVEYTFSSTKGSSGARESDKPRFGLIGFLAMSKASYNSRFERLMLQVSAAGSAL
jgi:hypothetical protein